MFSRTTRDLRVIVDHYFSRICRLCGRKHAHCISPSVYHSFRAEINPIRRQRSRRGAAPSIYSGEERRVAISGAHKENLFTFSRVGKQAILTPTAPLFTPSFTRGRSLTTIHNQRRRINTSPSGHWAIVGGTRERQTLRGCESLQGTAGNVARCV